MYIKHPKDKSLINIDHYWDIRCCSVNVTHIDFYLKPLAAGKRGKPALTIVFDTEKEREGWFKKLVTRLY